MLFVSSGRCYFINMCGITIGIYRTNKKCNQDKHNALEWHQYYHKNNFHLPPMSSCILISRAMVHHIVQLTCHHTSTIPCSNCLIFPILQYHIFCFFQRLRLASCIKLNELTRNYFELLISNEYYLVKDNYAGHVRKIYFQKVKSMWRHKSITFVTLMNNIFI